MKRGIAVDFDGVLHLRPKTEKGAELITGPVVPGAMNFLRHLTSAFYVTIFSTRFYKNRTAENNCREWLRRQLQIDSEEQERNFKKGYDWNGIVASLQFSSEKSPKFSIILDDRAIQFTGTFPNIPDLVAFRPWHS